MDPNEGQNSKGLGTQIADAAKKEAVNQGKRLARKGLKVAAKAIFNVMKKAVQFLFQMLVNLIRLAIQFWPVTLVIIIVILVICMAVYVLEMFKTNSEEEELNDITSSTEILYDYMRIWENTTLYEYRIGEGDGGKYVGPNGYYTVFYGGDKDRTYNIAYGIVISRNYNIDRFAKVMGKTQSETQQILYSYTTDGEEFTHLTADGVEKIFESIVEEKREYVKDELGDSMLSKLQQHQIDALSAVAYQYGNIGNFKSVYDYYEEGDKETFRSNFIVNGYTPFLQGWEGVNAGNNRRATANWTLFDTGVYSGNGYTLDPSDYGPGGISSEIVEIVIAYAENAAEEKWEYTQNTTLRMQDGYADCSSLVYRAFQEAGISVPSNTRSYASQAGNKEINIESAQRGDVLWATGHVALYAGDGWVIEASSSKGIVVKRQYGDSISDVINAREFTKAYRFTDVLSSSSDISTVSELTSSDIYYSGQRLSSSSGRRRYAQGFAITNLGSSREMVWYGYDGKDSDWASFYVRGYRTETGSLVYKKTFKNATHQAFEVTSNSTSRDDYYLYIGSRGSTKYDYYAYSKGVSRKRISSLTTTASQENLASQGKNFGTYISAISVKNERIALLEMHNGNRVKIYELASRSFTDNLDDPEYSFSISECGTPVQGIALDGNNLWVVAGYGTYSSSRLGMYIYRFDIRTGDLEYSSDRINVNLDDWEPQGIRIYTYNGTKYIFLCISDKDNKRSTIYYMGAN